MDSLRKSVCRGLLEQTLQPIFLRTISAKDHLTLTDVDASGHYPVHADPFEIQFIIANFIKNSLSAIEGKKDGAIQVRISDLGESWKVSVSDNGPGISDETLIRLRKGEAGQSSKTDGLGFGLAIASMLAERNGGHLEYNQPRAGGLEASLIIGKNTNRINPDTKQVSGDHQA